MISLTKTPGQYVWRSNLKYSRINIFRTVYLNLGRLSPKRKCQKRILPLFRDNGKDGIVIIPDFLPADKFAELRKNLMICIQTGRRSNTIGRFYKEAEGFPRLFQNHCGKIITPNTPAFTNYFMKSDLINELTSAVVNRQIRITPHHHFWYLKRRTLDKEGDKSFHSAGYPHQDVSYPQLKCFYT